MPFPFEKSRLKPQVPRQWQGQTAFLLASGPSLTQADVDAVRGKGKVLAVNDCWRLAPWADAVYACDTNWWEVNQGLSEFAGQKWTQCDLAAKTWGLNWIAGKHADGLSIDPTVIHYGSNSGYQALNLAALFGAKRIVLLGYDMQPTGDKRHWFGDHPEGMNNPQEDTFARWRAAFETVRDTGIEIINASRETALTCFPRRDLISILGMREC